MISFRYEVRHNMEVSNTTLSLNYIFVRSTIPTVVRSASAIVHRNYNLDIAYEMSLANNSAYWKPNFYIKKINGKQFTKKRWTQFHGRYTKFTNC